MIATKEILCYSLHSIVKNVILQQMRFAQEIGRSRHSLDTQVEKCINAETYNGCYATANALGLYDNRSR